jgi:cellulose synthase/poly-beta-1,6-N-acetylglucosamine synthase-like glycosyltransferase
LRNDQTPPLGFTVGICASDSASQLLALLSFLRTEDYGRGFGLSRVVVVASGCPESILTPIRKLSESDSRIFLIEESKRHGKAEAINRILGSSLGEYLIMLNADAFPDPGSIRSLLSLVAEPSVGAVSAQPIFDEGDGLVRRSLTLMWSAHSLLSLELNHAGLSNHACDELMVVRKSLVSSLPTNVVNDGAYIGGLVRARGFSVKFSEAAKVRITVPHTAIDLIRQRRRIIFGHVQVWKELGNAPRTLESMLFMDPLASFKTFVRVVSGRPRLIASIPLLLVGESISVLMGLFDAARSTGRHTVWRRSAV